MYIFLFIYIYIYKKKQSISRKQVSATVPTGTSGVSLMLCTMFHGSLILLGRHRGGSCTSCMGRIDFFGACFYVCFCMRSCLLLVSILAAIWLPIWTKIRPKVKKKHVLKAPSNKQPKNVCFNFENQCFRT